MLDTNTVEKLDTIYNEVLLPHLKMKSTRLNKKSVDIHMNTCVIEVRKILSEAISLSHLIKTIMRPYLEQKGYTINSWNSGVVTISWQ